MSFLTKLQIDGSEHNVLHCSFNFSQLTDAIGKPSSIPIGGKVKVTVESTGDTELYDWMISPTMTKSGTITFYRRDTMSKLKVLAFTDAHCVEYHEEYHHQGEYPMQISIILSAKELNLNGSDFKNNWPE